MCKMIIYYYNLHYFTIYDLCFLKLFISFYDFAGLTRKILQLELGSDPDLQKDVFVVAVRL